MRAYTTSLSARRAWIEISMLCSVGKLWVSLSARRAWIEIIDDLEPSSTRRVALRKESVDRNSALPNRFGNNLKSLSARRAWIEIKTRSQPSRPRAVALRKESVDRNYIIKITVAAPRRRSPQGERG